MVRASNAKASADAPGRAVKLWPVFVPTKGRAGRVSEAVLSLSPTLLVEEEEHELYRSAYSALKISIHPERGRGVSYARNRVLCKARERGVPWAWMVDDDLFEFGVRDGVKMVPKPAGEVLALAQAQILAEKQVGMAGLPAAWANCTGGGIRFNQCMYSCVALYLPAFVGLEYRESLKLKEDLDMTLQIVARGWKAGRLDDFYHSMPHPGTHAGGLDETYATAGLEEAMAQKMVELWPGVVRARPGVKRETVDWEAISRGLPQTRPQDAGEPLSVHPWRPPQLKGGTFHRPRCGASGGR
jgi:hypothetical protein